MSLRRPVVETIRSCPSNDLLSSMSESDFALIAPHLKDCQAALNDILYDIGDDVGSVYFPCGPSLVSHELSIENGRKVEILLIGREGAIGQMTGPKRASAYSALLVKIGGPLVKISAAELEKAKSNSGTIRALFDTYMNCLLAQVMQTAVCNAAHSVEQRLAKWISSVTQRTGQNEVPFTQDQLANVLGVGRSYATRIIQSLKMEGILDTRRGAIRVVDRSALQARSCRCDDLLDAYFYEILGRSHKPNK